MSKFQVNLLFVVITVCFLATLISFIKFRNGDLVFDAFSCTALLVLLICGIISVIHYQINSERICILLIPVINDELNRINVEDSIIELRSDQVGSIIDSSLKLRFCMAQSSGLLFSEGSMLQLDTSRDCKILFNDDDLAHVNTQSLCVLLKNVSDVKKLMKECKDLRIKYPEIKDGVLWLHYDASKVVNDEETLKVLLSSFQEDGLTIYDVLIKRLFHFCPGNEKSVDKNVSVTKEAWINTRDGKMSVYFLSIFAPLEVLGRKTVYENEEGDLNEKIEYVLNHIEQNGITTSEFNFTDLLEFIKEKIFGNRKSEMPLYSMMNRNLLLTKDIKMSLNDLICQDIKSGIYKYILAIACVNDGGDNCPFAETNYFIQCLLFLQGYEGLVSQMRNMLNDYNGKINCNSPDYKNFKIDRVITMLSVKNSKECTNRELIKCAREYLVKRYVHQIAMLTGKSSFCSRIGSIESFVLISGKIPQLLNNVAVDNAVNADVKVEVE
ncbi:hypothetical protein K6025_02810 [Ehrlichia sp. JZT12]